MSIDLKIAQQATLQPITEIAEKLKIATTDLELYGHYKAKVPLSYIDEEKAKRGKLILVTALTPTPAGEGKTLTSVGLNEGLNKIGKRAIVALREPSLGPVFGIKGGATGGGYSQVVPMEDINLHFTGDFSAIEKANNLLSALIDNKIRNHEDELQLDPDSITWKRVMDVCDRNLRDIVTGLGGKANGTPRETGFNITAASEIMAILCLATDFNDLKDKLGNILIGQTYDRKPVYARDIDAVGAMTLLLKDAVKPNLVQTLEGNPAIIHGGPFANIAQGTNSILATKMALSLADYVVTEAGFGADLGAEKFLDIKCPVGGLTPDAVVIVATIRALKHHGGVGKDDLTKSNPEMVKAGFPNLMKHIENIRQFGLEPVIAINHFVSDTEEEVNMLRELCKSAGVAAEISRGWEKGGEGTTDLAKAVVQKIEQGGNNFQPLYNKEDSLEQKIETIATKIYGAKEVKYSSKAVKWLKRMSAVNLDQFPVCMAKTQKSFSDDPNLLGRPKDFTITVQDFEIAAGAGFIIPLLGDMMRMPGLPKTPASTHMDLDEEGNITGLS